MKKWPRRIRGAVGMGLTWAAGWAFAGVLIGVTSILLPFLPWHYFFETFDAPLPALAIPGFFGGVLFSTVLGIAGRGRRFRDLSLPRFTAWGAAGGLLLTLFPFALVAVGLASLNPGARPWPIIAAIVGPFTLLSAVSASITLMVARKAESRDLLEASDDVGELGRAESGAQELLGGGDVLLYGQPAVRHGEHARSDRASAPSDA
jgi:hypothetical protein